MGVKKGDLQTETKILLYLVKEGVDGIRHDDPTPGLSRSLQLMRRITGAYSTQKKAEDAKKRLDDSFSEGVRGWPLYEKGRFIREKYLDGGEEPHRNYNYFVHVEERRINPDDIIVGENGFCSVVVKDDDLETTLEIK